jgi:porphyrinogen peroxidase
MTSGPVGPGRTPQPIIAPPARVGHVLVVTVLPGAESVIRDFCAELPGLVRAVGSRDFEAEVSCVVGFSYDAWSRITGRDAPAGLRRLEPVHGVLQTVPATPGDLVFHVRAAHQDVAFEVALQILAALRGAVRVALEVQGFRYFDNRNLLGFVDGTENPVGPAAEAAALIGSEDPEHAGGSFLLVQKYLFDLEAWNELPGSEQERVIGRDKLTNIALQGDAAETNRQLAAIDDGGRARTVLRYNVSFGNLGAAELGSLFVGYSASPRVLEAMLRILFVGVPAGNYHPFLDYARAVSAGLFYAPSATLFERISDRGQTLPGRHGDGRLRSVSPTTET